MQTMHTMKTMQTTFTDTTDDTENAKNAKKSDKFSDFSAQFVCQLTGSFPMTSDRFIIFLREAPPKLSPGSKGHCPNSDCKRVPLLNGTAFNITIIKQTSFLFKYLKILTITYLSGFN